MGSREIKPDVRRLLRRGDEFEPMAVNTLFQLESVTRHPREAGGSGGAAPGSNLAE
jgi:hypothetical protein